MQLTTTEPRNYRETVFDNPAHEMPFPTTRSDVFLIAPMIGGYERFRQLVLSAPMTHRATPTSIAVDALLHS